MCREIARSALSSSHFPEGWWGSKTPHSPLLWGTSASGTLHWGDQPFADSSAGWPTPRAHSQTSASLPHQVMGQNAVLTCHPLPTPLCPCYFSSCWLLAFPRVNRAPQTPRGGQDANSLFQAPLFSVMSTWTHLTRFPWKDHTWERWKQHIMSPIGW